MSKENQDHLKEEALCGTPFFEEISKAKGFVATFKVLWKQGGWKIIPLGLFLLVVWPFLPGKNKSIS